jgi:hypothetical protein
MDMFDLIEANEGAVVEAQGLRAELYEIMGIDYDGRDDYYTLDIRPKRGTEAATWGVEWFEGEITRTELLELLQEA